MKWEDFATPHPEDKLFAFEIESRQHCDGTHSTKCTIHSLTAYREYTVCLAVCHPNTSSNENEANTMSVDNLREHSTSTNEPTTVPYELIEFNDGNYTCAWNACVQLKTLPKG